MPDDLRPYSRVSIHAAARNYETVGNQPETNWTSPAYLTGALPLSYDRQTSRDFLARADHEFMTFALTCRNGQATGHSQKNQPSFRR